MTNVEDIKSKIESDFAERSSEVIGTHAQYDKIDATKI
jgi:hypothetical protein